MTMIDDDDDRLSTWVRSKAPNCDASSVTVAGYSMGGFGAYQLACHDANLFDFVVTRAGYGWGTAEPPSSSCGAPKPKAEDVFQEFLTNYIARLSTVGIIYAIHAPSDSASSFADMEAIVMHVCASGGRATMMMMMIDDNDDDGDVDDNNDD